MTKQDSGYEAKKKKQRGLLFITLTFAFLFPVLSDSNCQRTWTFNVFLGDAYCFNMPLEIRQEGYSNLKINAHYRTEAFKLPVYYSWKAGTARNKKGWELELIHLKIILTNNPPEVQQFEVSHGYNYLTVNHIRDLDFMILRFGIGTIISHPESIVRNQWYDNHQGIMNRGYHFSGPAVQIAAEKRFKIKGGLFCSLEVKAAAAYAKVGIANGQATVPQAGIHGLAGLGYTFNKKEISSE